MSFGADLRGFASRTSTKLDDVVRQAVTGITTEMVAMTPVDTGHARSNYFWGVQRVTATDPAMSANGAPSLARAFTFSQSVKAGGVVYLTNNLPYIMALEYGHSKQTPAGMARVTVAKWQQIVNAAVASL